MLVADDGCVDALSLFVYSSRGFEVIVSTFALTRY